MLHVNNTVSTDTFIPANHFGAFDEAVLDEAILNEAQNDASVAYSPADRQNQRESRQSSCGVTELTLTQHFSQQLYLILPMIAALSQTDEDRWITWVGPTTFSEQLLIENNVDISKIQVLYPNEKHSQLKLMQQVLRNGESMMVVAPELTANNTEFELLEIAAIKGNCRGLIINERF